MELPNYLKGTLGEESKKEETTTVKPKSKDNKGE